MAAYPQLIQSRVFGGDANGSDGVRSAPLMPRPFAEAAVAKVKAARVTKDFILNGGLEKWGYNVG